MRTGLSFLLLVAACRTGPAPVAPSASGAAAQVFADFTDSLWAKGPPTVLPYLDPAASRRDPARQHESHWLAAVQREHRIAGVCTRRPGPAACPAPTPTQPVLVLYVVATGRRADTLRFEAGLVWVPVPPALVSVQWRAYGVVPAGDRWRIVARDPWGFDN